MHTLMRNFILILCLAGALSHCRGLDLDERSRPVESLKKISVTTKNSRHHAEIYQTILEARKLENKSPEAAISKYIYAAYRVSQLREDSLLPLYNHAVGQAIDLLTEQANRGVTMPRSLQWGGAAVNLDVSAKDEYGYGIADFDDILPADMLSYSGWRTDVKSGGVGSALVAQVKKNSLDRRHCENLPYRIPSSGYNYPLTGLVHFTSKLGKISANIQFINPVDTGQIDLWGKKRAVSKNLTAPLAVSLSADKRSRNNDRFTLLGVFKPQRFSEKMGIYSLGPLDPKKVPVVLVHGLNSDPITWRNVFNELNADSILRKKYQFLAFYYPTGLPLRVSGAELKRSINDVHQYYAKHGQSANANHMIIVGHSLGGLLTSAQVRKIDKQVWQKAFKDSADASLIQNKAKEDFSYFIHGPKPTFVKRVVFIATPHRGSRRADMYVVKLLSSLVKLPKKMMVFNTPQVASALTDFGRAVFGVDNPSNSLTVLRSHSAPLRFLSDSPMYDHIEFHSIMGDRGRGDTPNSSDGVVAYSSSHLDGAKSEVIVPADHAAHDHPQAINELSRILHLHLKSK